MWAVETEMEKTVSEITFISRTDSADVSILVWVFYHPYIKVVDY